MFGWTYHNYPSTTTNVTTIYLLSPFPGTIPYSYTFTLVDYVEDYFQLTPSDEQKRIRELHQYFNKQKSHCQTIYHQD